MTAARVNSMVMRQCRAMGLDTASHKKLPEKRPGPTLEIPGHGNIPRWNGSPQKNRRLQFVRMGLHYTGQRGGDVVAMKWADFDGKRIFVVQEKTGKKLWLN